MYDKTKLRGDALGKYLDHPQFQYFIGNLIFVPLVRGGIIFWVSHSRRKVTPKTVRGNFVGTNFVSSSRRTGLVSYFMKYNKNLKFFNFTLKSN